MLVSDRKQHMQRPKGVKICDIFKEQLARVLSTWGREGGGWAVSRKR